jgi:hypothetical protein
MSFLRLTKRLQFHHERRPLPFPFRFRADGAVMRLDHLLRHEEPESRAADVDLAAVLGPGEFLEEARQDFRRDADPGVFDA